MRISGRPMFTTIMYGLVAGMSFIPMVIVMSSLLQWTAAFRLAIWFVLAGYLIILSRWGRVSLLSIVFPLLLLLFLVFWGNTTSAFLLLALGVLSWVRSGICFQGGLLKTLGVLSWVRSGICFQGSLLKTLATEVALCLGAGALVVFFTPHSTITWGVAVWMFFLVQSVYFVVFADFGEKQEEKVERDPFHQARTRAERILSAEL